MRIVSLLFGLFLLAVGTTPALADGTSSASSSASQMDGELMDVQTNLSTDHPCYAYGATWLGWCMVWDEATGYRFVNPSGSIRTGGIYPQMTSRAIRLAAEACLDVVDRSERQACYRDERLMRYGFESSVRVGGSVGVSRVGRNIYYYITD